MKNFYKSVTENSFDKKLGNPTEPCYSDDSLVYKALLIKERYGWDIFKNVFRNFFEFPREFYKDTQRFAWFAKYLGETVMKIRDDAETVLKTRAKFCPFKSEVLNNTTYWRPLKKVFLFAKFIKYYFFNLKTIDINDPSLNQFLSKLEDLTPIFSDKEIKILKDKFISCSN